jgi:hypothetical protein
MRQRSHLVFLSSLASLASILLLLLPAGAAMSTEEPKFTVVRRTERYEIRRYGPTLVAETLVDAGFDEAGNRAFRILADYIFGNNRSRTQLAGAAPVALQAPSEKLAMTAPVNLVKADSGFLVQFTMPEGYALGTLPEPNDARVRLRELPARSVAVLGYSGSWGETRYEEKLGELRAALQVDGLRPVGAPVFARFNSPFKLWFLRRNEIWIEVVE